MMDGDFRKGGDPCRQLLDLIPKERCWMSSNGGMAARIAAEGELELRLGPPGVEWMAARERRNPPMGAVEPKTEALQQQCPPTPHAAASNNAAAANHRRIASTPVVGWPPVRSFRKNLGSTSSKPLESQDGSSKAVAKIEHERKGLFVKINMDGVPIGRKVDLKACNSYEKLSLAVDELFRGLLAAQMAGTQTNATEKHAIMGLLDGCGEYTLVYQDEEGDRMLVGDVPWDMFVSTVKRLRVLKSSELSTLSVVAFDGKRMATKSKVA